MAYNPLMRPYFFGGVALGGGPLIPMTFVVFQCFPSHPLVHRTLGVLSKRSIWMFSDDADERLDEISRNPESKAVFQKELKVPDVLRSKLPLFPYNRRWSSTQ